MNASEAKKPKFDGGWWAKHKAEHADEDRSFEHALDNYQRVIGEFFKDAARSNMVSVGDVKLALEEVSKAAKATHDDKKLGIAQKDTKQALTNYIKLADAAKGELARVVTAPVMKASAELLVKKMPQFESYCKQNHEDESFNFLSVMYKNPKHERQFYDDFIKDRAKFMINLPSKYKRQFDDIADAIDSGAQPDTVASWDLAPWDEAVKEIEKLFLVDVIPRFRNFMCGEILRGSVPND